jgi:PhnB protein
MQVSTHLTFRGQCEAAFKFYEKCLGGAIVTMLTYGDSPTPEQVPVEWRGKIVHASMTIGDRVLAGADALPEHYEQPQGFYLLLDVDDAEEAERVFNALSEHGVVRMQMQKTFWSPAFGVLIDQFGIPWEVSSK